MDSKQFYELLRKEDRENVRNVVEELKQAGFEVYVAGSSLEREDYNDVDLVVKPGKDMTQGDVEGQLEHLLNASRPGVTLKRSIDFIDSSDIISEFEHEITERVKILYAGSEIGARYQMDIPAKTRLPEGLPLNAFPSFLPAGMNSTLIDISLSYDPFALIPETKHIQL